jgi:hypothetical protein
MRKDLLFLIVLALLVRICLYSLIDWTTLGADVGRFAIISHTWYLKGEITPNLQPYDMATGFLYFPLGLILLYLSEFITNPILATTAISITISFLGTLVFYKIARIFLDEQKAVGAYFWWAFLFDFVFTYAFFGVFTTALAMFFFLIFAWQSLEFYFGKEFNKWILTASIAGALLSHGYILLFMAVFSLALAGWEYVEKGNIHTSFSLGKLCSIGILLTALLYIPWAFVFGKYYDNVTSVQNISDLFAFAERRETFDLLTRFRVIFGTSYIGAMESAWLYLGFLAGAYGLFTGFLKDRKVVLLYLSVMTVFASVSIFNDMNLLRVCSLLWLPYAIFVGYFFNDTLFNLFMLVPLFLMQSPSILFMTNTILNYPERVVPYVNFVEFNRMVGWIKQNTSINSTFLIDGGGSGCTGASANYGERLFPLTDRRIFYFTDYCWAEYNTTEYEKRVDIYRRISINPDDKEALQELKDYGVNYVFVGDRPVGFNRTLFEESENYELEYNQSNLEIFKVN